MVVSVLAEIRAEVSNLSCQSENRNYSVELSVFNILHEFLQGLHIL